MNQTRTLPWLPVAAVLLFLSGGATEPSKTDRQPNRLINASSPYLLQHAYNPVDWNEWNEETLARAKREDKPIFLSIGYAACHWCHVMERESFENEAIAKILNQHFICIKVDREERPDIDEIYMAATVAKTGRGGWPMTVFMTPDGKPFECGTYFPPQDRRGRRGLTGLASEIGEKWKTDRESLINGGESLAQQVIRAKRSPSGRTILPRKNLSQNVERLASRFDPQLGGRRSQRNKFPPTMAMELMLREFATQTALSKPHLVDLVETTLTHMADGGIYDQIGGGICRYSTDPRWFAPHFEKMLYDQGTVSGVYLSAYQVTRNEKYAETARGILDYCIKDLQSPAGGFYSSRDADSEGEEGKFYVWRRVELEKILPREDLDLFCDYYNVSPRGNWHGGVNILHVNTTHEAFAVKHELSVDKWRARLARMQKVVFQARAQRIAPGLDDKILTEWNGLLITSLARAYRIFDEPRYRDAAQRAARFFLDTMIVDGRLYRAHRKGKTHIPAYATDYANLIEALITLYEVSFDRHWLNEAEKLNKTFIQYFRDPSGGFFYTASDAEKLLVRSKNARDSVVPSCNSTAVLNFLRLGILLHRSDLRDLAEETMQSMQPLLSRGALERLQWAVGFYHDHPKEVAIVGDLSDPNTLALINEVYRHYVPNKVVAAGKPEDALAPGALPLLKRKTLQKGKPAAYVCRDYVCGRPVTSPTDLAKQLLERKP